MTPDDEQDPVTRMDQDTQRRHHPQMLFGLACAVILTLFVAAYYQASASIESLATLREQSTRLDAVDNLLIDLLNAETGVRGYLISGNREYLEPYIEAVGSLDKYLRDVGRSVDEFDHLDSDMKQLGTLIGQYKMLFQELIDDKREGWNVDQGDLYLSKLYFDQARQILARFKSHLTFDSSAFFQQATRGQTYTRWAVFAMCTAAFVFLIWLFVTLQKQAVLRKTIVDILAQENEKLDRAVARRTRQLTRLAAQLTRVGEAEKQRLARELHDDMGASLTAAKMDASWLAGKSAEFGDETLIKRTQRLIGSLDQAITLKRRLTTDLLPPLLAQLGLFESLRSLGEDLAQQTEIAVDLEVPEQQPTLDHATSLALFRIAQEALTNVRKYANATRVALNVSVTDDLLEMEVVDDGRGFDVTAVNVECFGLVSMRHRARMIGADIAIDTSPGGGTRIRASLPLNQDGD